MKMTLSPFVQRWLAIGTLVLATIVLWVFVIAPVWASIAQHEERVAMLRQQAAKLQALMEAAPRLEAAARAIEANPSVRSLAFDAAPGTAVAELQTVVNRAFSSAGAIVMSGQTLEGRAEAVASEIAVQATVEADIAALVQALHTIGASRPLLKIERISVREPDAEFAAAVPVGPQPNVVNKLIVDVVVSAHTRGAL